MANPLITPTEADLQRSVTREPFPDFYEAMKEEENERRAIFGSLEKVRVRYDVEVVTKLIIYSGIAWLAVEFIPLLFEVVGLGMERQEI